MKDFFGNKLRVGQRVLHISRHSSNIRMYVNEVTKIEDDKVWTLHRSRWVKSPRPVRVIYPERLVIHPEDVEVKCINSAGVCSVIKHCRDAGECCGVTHINADACRAAERSEQSWDHPL